MARHSLMTVLILVLFAAAVSAIQLDLNPGIPIRTITYINVTIDPEAPDTSDEVKISVKYLVDVPEEHLWIFVDDENVEECEGKTCSYEGGPYDGDFTYYIVYLDSSGGRKFTDEKTVHVSQEAVEIELPAVIPELDSDADGIPDSEDNCRFVPNPNQSNSDVKKVCHQVGPTPGSSTCGIENDGLGDACDNCPIVYNKDQKDSDNDTVGDACDNCPLVNNTKQEDFDDDGFGNKCDNCYWKANPDQNDTDTIRVCPADFQGAPACDARDGVGDACDNCPAIYNPGDAWGDQSDDKDADSVGDACDNCPDVKNKDQKDSNHDGVGDACTYNCSDGIFGAGEDGIDCGGVCPKACPACIPVVYNGDPKGKINIVFVMDTDYNGDTALFKSDIMNLIENGYYKSSEIAAGKCKFNFYYHKQAGNYIEVCKAWDLPASFWSDCSFAHSAAIIFKGGDRACSSDVFSAPRSDPATIVHETGHKIFGMADEYCCDGGYGQPSPGQPNIYSSQANCQAMSDNPSTCDNYCPEKKCWPGDATAISKCKGIYNAHGWTNLEECDCKAFAKKWGLPESECTAIASADCPAIMVNWWENTIGMDQGDLTMQSPNWCYYRDQGVKYCCQDGGDGWWKSDPDACTMLNGAQFEADCQERIKWTLNPLPTCGGGLLGEIDFSSWLDAKDKVILIDFEFGNGTGRVINKSAVYNRPPKRLDKPGKYEIISRSSDDKPLYDFVIPDPLDFDLGNHSNFESGRRIGEKARVTLIVPLDFGIETVDVVDNETGQVISSVDVSDVVDAICAGKNEPGCVPLGEQPPEGGGQPPGEEQAESARVEPSGGTSLDLIIYALAGVAAALIAVAAIKFRPKK